MISQTSTSFEKISVSVQEDIYDFAKAEADRQGHKQVSKIIQQALRKLKQSRERSEAHRAKAIANIRGGASLNQKSGKALMRKGGK